MQFNKKKIFSKFALISTLFLVACSSQTTQQESNAPKDTFTYAINGNATSTNPITTSDRYGLTMTNIVFSPLVKVSGDGTVTNVLAESVNVSNDGLTVTIKLRKDVKWSDGEPFTADDVIFTYQNKADKKNGNYATLWVNDKPIQFEKVDDYTVDFKLPEVSGAAVASIAEETYIIPKHIYKDVQDFSVNDLGITPVGTGPYKLVEYKRDEYMSFEANENYFDGKPSIQKVILRITPNADTAKIALQKGEVDAAVVLPSDIASLDSATITTYPYSENRIGYLGMNALTKELSDVKVRQAIMYALNKDEMNIAAYLSSDYYTNPYSFLPPQNKFSSNNVEKYSQNIETAKQLLQEAGVTTLNLKLGYTASDAAQTLQATLIQQQLAKINVNVELAGVDSSALSAELKKAGYTSYHMFLNGYIWGNDPSLYARMFTSDGKNNYFQFKNVTIDKLFKDGASELEEAKRKTIYEQVQQEIAKEAVIYPIVDNKRVLAVNKRISGVEEAKLVPIYTFEDISKLIIK